MGRRGGVPLRRLCDVPWTCCRVFHLRRTCRTCNVAGTYIETSLTRHPRRLVGGWVDLHWPKENLIKYFTIVTKTLTAKYLMKNSKRNYFQCQILNHFTLQLNSLWTNLLLWNRKLWQIIITLLSKFLRKAIMKRTKLKKFQSRKRLWKLLQAQTLLLLN